MKMISGRTGFHYLLILCAILFCMPGESAEKKMTKRKITKLVEQYNTAIKKQDFETWQELLSPMHPESPKLEQDSFTEGTQMIRSLSIEEIDGLNVLLELKHSDGNKTTGWLQLHDSGHIKYTPLVFKHPIRQTCVHLETLFMDETSLMGSSVNDASRHQIASDLAGMGIPLHGYRASDPNESRRRTAAGKMLAWIEENGKTFDSTEPKVFIPESEFEEYIARVRKAAQ